MDWTAFQVHVLIGVSGVFIAHAVRAMFDRSFAAAATWYAISFVLSLAGGFVLHSHVITH